MTPRPWNTISRWISRARRERRRQNKVRSFRPLLEMLETREVPAAILPGFDANTLSGNDDGSTGAIDLGFAVNFFGKSYSQVYVNNNGNITFGQASSQFTPTALTNSNQTPRIAPFFADVDTRASAALTYGNGTVDGHAAFGVTWPGVGYYGSHADKLNKFQLVLVSRGDSGASDFDVEFNYDQIQWETGDASGGSGGLGGTNARLGYTAGTGKANTYFEMAGATGAFLDDARLTGLIHQHFNSDVDGRLIFQFRGGDAPATPLPFNVSLAGGINTDNPSNDWSFFGRATQGVTVTVHTGGNSSPPQPLPPTINYAQVQLLDSHNHVLATAANTNSGTDATITGFTLPADDTYRLHITAGPTQPDATGNYIVLAGDATIHNYSLTPNQVTYGNLYSPFAVDRYSFEGRANTSMQLLRVGAQTSGLQFDLVGPNGEVLFSNLTTNSDPVTLPSTGHYVLTAHGSGGLAGAYAFSLNQIAQTTLTLGTPYNGQIDATGQWQLFKFDVTTPNPVRIKLDDSTNTDVNEVYVRRGSPPTRGAFDFRSTVAAADQNVQVPFATPGTWYILVYTRTAPNPSSFSLLADSSPLIVNSVTPDGYAAGAGANLTLSGGGFLPGSTVTLESSGNTVATAQATHVDTFSRMTATFDLTSVATGTYDVRVTLPDTSTALLPGAFHVLPAGSARLETHLILPNSLGRHGVATLYLEYSNTGTSAMPAPILTVQSADPDGSDRPFLSLNQNDLTQGFWTSALPEGFSHSVQIYASGATPGLLLPGESIQVPIYYAGLQQPWDFSDNQVEFEVRVHDAGSTEAIDWAGLKESLRPASVPTDAWDAIFANLTADVGTTWGDYVGMLNRNAVYLSRVGVDTSDVNRLFGFAVGQAVGLSPASSVTTADDAALVAPGLPLDFIRSFGGTITERYQAGPFGRGWSAPWQIGLEQQTDGTVVIHQSANGERIFEPDSRAAGHYLAGPGDPGVLRLITGGEFELTESSGQVTRFHADGTLDFIQDINGNRITATFTSGQLTSLTHSNGASIDLSYDGAGHIISLTAHASPADVTGRTTTYAYDGNGLLTTVTNAAGTTTYTYDTGTNPATKYALLSLTGPSGVTQAFEYDTHGRLTAAYLPSNVQRLNFSYNLGAVTTTDAVNAASTVYFDDTGLVVRTEDGLGDYVRYEYNDLRQLVGATDSLGHTLSYTRCDCGRPTSITDELGNTSSFALGGPHNDPTAFTDSAGNVTHFSYDANGNRTGTTYADNSTESVVLDAAGDPTQLINRRNETVALTRNAAGQVTREDFPGGTFNTYTYDTFGRLATATDSHGTTTFTYDATDRLTRVDYPSGRWIQYTFDAAGRRTYMEQSTGTKIHYLYDSIGRLQELRDASGASETSLVTYTYDAAGNLTREDKANGTYTLYTYDAARRLSSVINYAPDNSINSKFLYTYDGLGRRTSVVTSDGTWAYNYDLTGQLAHAVFTSTNVSIPNQDLSYTYDALGNRISTVLNGTATNYSSNNLNEYTNVGGTTHTYDADGNLTDDGTHQYTYDALGRLTQVVSGGNTWQYEYDAFGNRVATVYNGQRTEYMLDPTGLTNIAATFDGGGNLTASYVGGVGLAATSVGGAWDFYDSDALGNVAGLSGAAGTYANSYAYDPFGGTLLAKETVANQFQFGGEQGVTAEGNGLDFMRARLYDVSVGRFVSVDPLRLDGGDANLYRYSANAPVNTSDPTGLYSQFMGFSGGFIGSFTGGITIDYNTCTWYYTIGGGFTTGGVNVMSTSWGTGRPGEPSVSPGTAVDVHATGGHEMIGATVHGSIQGDVHGNSSAGAAVSVDEGLGVPGAGLDIIGYIYGGELDPDICWPPPPHRNPPPPPGGSGSSGASGTAGSFDPNDLIGPTGYGPQHYVGAHAVLPYRIDFENDANASAPAQRVVIVNHLSSDLDWNTFQFTGAGYGDTHLTIAGGEHYESTNWMTYNGKTFNVDILADLDPSTGLLTVTFQSIDPGTFLPPDVLTGFLPPEDGSGRGMGYITYTVQPRDGLATGTVIRNTALITFDANTSIATDQIDPHNPAAGTDPTKEAPITIDAGLPTATVSLPKNSLKSFPVTWSGSDPSPGTGIAGYDVFVSVNGGTWTPWLTNTPLTSAVFDGEFDTDYAFYAIAIDNAGNREEQVPGIEAQTHTAPWGQSLTAINEDATNPAGTKIATIIQGHFSDPDPNAKRGIAVSETLGNGNWQYSPNGTTWTNFGAVSESQARLLPESYFLRFLPGKDFNGTAGLLFYGWDGAQGTAGSTTAIIGTGAGHSFSLHPSQVTVNVNPVNDAPFWISLTGATLTTTARGDANPPGDTVDAIFGSRFRDIDGSTPTGVAVVGTTGTGNWQYSQDGGTTWNNIGAASASAARLLGATDKIRFVPGAGFSGAATILADAWDASTGTDGSTVDLSGTGKTGGTTSFGTKALTASVLVNAAPTLGVSGPTLPSINEDTTSAAMAVSLLTVSQTDADAGAKQGVAIVGASGPGKWQYSLNGTTFFDLGAVSDTGARLLPSSAKLKFIPAANQSGSATLTYRAWDQTAGTAGTLVNVTTNGGGTAFSATMLTATLTVSPVNDAPTWINTAGTLFTPIAEGTTSPAGDTVASIFGGRFADVDAGTKAGVAVVGLTGASSAGAWQFSTDNGVTWTAFGTASSSAARLLAGSDEIRFLPSPTFTGVVTLQARAWDGSAGVDGSTANVNANGGATAFSSNVLTAGLAVNTAPTLGGTPLAFTATNEDVVSAAVGVSGVTSTDPDTGALKGLAVVGATGAGTWEYTLNGSTYLPIGGVAADTARLLPSSAKLRFRPAANQSGSATISYRAWDQTAGKAGDLFALTGSGGATAFSATSQTSTITVNPVNDAPTWSAGSAVALTPALSGDSNPAGNTVASIFGARFSDVENATVGVAIMGPATVTGGTWQFSTNGGASWTNFGALADKTARLLAATNLIRFVPSASFAGTATLQALAWDGTSGIAGGVVDLSGIGKTGGATAFSSAILTAGVLVNTAPTLGATGPTLPGTNEDVTTPALAVSLLTGIQSDADAGALKGVAIVGATGPGTWQYSLNGTKFFDLGAVSPTSARLLPASAKLKFIPAPNQSGSATLTYHAWDQTSGLAGSLVSITATGGSTAFSTTTAIATLAVAPVNDAPVLSLLPLVQLTVPPGAANPAGDDVAVLVAGAVTDADAGALQGVAITSLTGATNGTWEFSTDGGTTWQQAGTVSSTSALLLRAGDRLRFVPKPSFLGTVSLSFRAWDQTSGSAGAKVNPTGSAFSVVTKTATLLVNTAPTLAP
jgi:RHS repeat-associated protein